jgi:SAM-dependent methyltransferase
MAFKDHFSRHADDYARYRPDYPGELFEFLASTVARHQTAWDCGTGNGQAALGLTPYFDRVIASDPSAGQIRLAAAHEKISYRVSPAEATDIPAHTVDLITVAQALHWFDFAAFYREVRRVLKSDGWLAVWCYGLTRINPAVDEVVQHYYTEIVGPYWPPERQYIDAKYQTIPFPFTEMPAPEYQMNAAWDLEAFIGYLGSWSASRQFRQSVGHDPLDLVRGNLVKSWGQTERRLSVRWPLYLRLGKVTAVE